MPCYPRWARAMAFPVSCYRVSPSGGPYPVRWASVARCLPTVGSHSEASLPISDTIQGVPSISLGPRPRTGSPVVVPNSFALGQLSKPLGAQLSNPWTVT